MKTLFSLLALLFFVVAFAFPLSAQNTGGRTAAQKDADVQWFLKNDEDVAQLKQQLRAKEVSNVEYTKRFNELSAERNKVLGRYDRSGQREIIALYNAAKKDLQAAVLEAKRKADAEARAKVLADREAARQAAADAAKAKAEAAQEQARLAALAKAEAAAAETKAIEDDAQAYTKIVIQHDGLWFKQQMGKISAAQQNQLSALAAEGEAIKKKYATGGSMSARGAEFQSRLKQLSQEQVVPANKRWVAEVFPEPAQVAADFSNENERAAALVFLRNLLMQKVAQPHPDEVTKKISGYLVAIEKIDPPSSRDHFKNSEKYNARSKDPAFRSDVVKKYLPAFAPEFQFIVKQEQFVAEQKAVSNRLNAGVFVLTLILLAMPLVFALTGGFFSRPKPLTAEQSKDPFQLPASLRNIKVLGKEYSVAMESGIIYDKEIWTETHTSTTTTGGGNTNQPIQTTTHVSSTVYHRYWIRTLDGKETWKRFSDDQFPASVGQIISTIDWGTVVILAYNHSSGQHAGGSKWTTGPHRLPGKKLWFVSMGIWLAGYFALNTLFGGAEATKIPHQNDLLWGGALMTAIFAAIYIGILKIIFQTIRNSQFKRKYAPEILKFIQQQTPELAKQFSGLPTVSAAKL